jgi:hypothetical protein
MDAAAQVVRDCGALGSLPGLGHGAIKQHSVFKTKFFLPMTATIRKCPQGEPCD